MQASSVADTKSGLDPRLGSTKPLDPKLIAGPVSVSTETSAISKADLLKVDLPEADAVLKTDNNPAYSAYLVRMTKLSESIQNRLKLNNNQQFHQAFMGIAQALPAFDHWQMEQSYKFVDGMLQLTRSSRHNRIMADEILENFKVFRQALPYYTSKSDLSYLPEIALSCIDAKTFKSCIDLHISISANEFMSDSQLATRGLIRSGLYAGESSLSILKELNNLSKSENFESLSQDPNLTLFFRGLILNSWTIAGSIMLLRSALDTNEDPQKVIFLAAQNSIKAKPNAVNNPFDPSESIFPSVLSFLNLGRTEQRELEFIGSFLYRYNEASEKFDQTAKKLFCLLEACRYSSCVEFESLSKRIQGQLRKEQDMDQLLTILLDNTLRSVDNKSARSLIEKVINSTHHDQYRHNIELLRSLHNADVPVEGKTKGHSEADRYAKQIEIFKEAISCFDLFQQVRLSIPLLSAELKRMPNGDSSLLSTFGYEVAKVNNLYATENSYPGSGVELYDFDMSSLFELDHQNPQDPLHRYHQTQGWSRRAVEDFLNSKVVILENMLIFSLRTDDALKFAGQNMCLVFYADSNQNYGADQCLLLPVALVDECLKSSRYDFMDLPDENGKLFNLSEAGLRSEDLRLQAYKLAMPIFDIGSATNIGGLSNSTGDFKAEPQNRYHLDRIFGLDSVDPWGNVKKMDLLKFPQLFSAHTDMHENLVRVFSRFAEAYKVFENRYSAWKKGATPVVENTDREWFGSLNANSQSYRMLNLAYNLHIQQRLNKDFEVPARICFYTQGKIQDGMLENFSLDISSLQLHMAGETIQFPYPKNLTDKDNLDNFIERYIFGSSAASSWDLYVRPNMSGRIPFLQFY